MSERRVKQKTRKPRFLWQGVLILAPVLVLAKLGALAVSQDRRMAQHEAELRAQDIAEEALDRIWRALQDSNQPPRLAKQQNNRRPLIVSDLKVPFNVEEAFAPARTLRMQIGEAGNLLAPSFYDEAPTPAPLDPGILTAAQREMWEMARAQAATNAPLSALANTYQRFIAASPPTNFLGNATLALGEVRMKLGMYPDADGCFSTVANQYFAATSESGLPIRPLAVFKQFHAQSANGIEPRHYLERYATAIQQILAEPTTITPALLDHMMATTNRHGLPQDIRNEKLLLYRKAQREWEDQEQTRRLYLAARPLLESHSALPLRSAANAASLAWPALSAPSPAFWVSLRGAQPAEIIVPQRYIESPPVQKQMQRPTDLPPLTPVSSNVMQLEAQERSQHLKTNFVKVSMHFAETNVNWLFVVLTNTSGRTILCREAAAATEVVTAALAPIRKPEFLEFSVRVADADLISSNRLQMLEHLVIGKGGGQIWKRNNTTNPPGILASALRNEGGHPLLAGSVHLVSPDLLFAQQEERATWFRLVIGGAMLAAIIGFLSAWRAFHKQLRLAEMKSNFVSSVSHELRAPIASVRLMAEGLERGKISEPAKQREYFRFITQECRRLSSMIENVLDFARIEQGRKQYEFEPTDVAALVEQTVKLMEPYAAERGVNLATNVEHRESRPGEIESPSPAEDTTTAKSGSPSPWGEGWGEGEQIVANIDGQAVQQALVNLIDNAVKHSPSGEEVLVRLEMPNPQPSIQNPQFLLSVEDHGPGIPATEHQKIFERFYRLGSELRRETPGVGIGLSIVKHIVEAHGGRVRVKSEVGGGSCFTMELPLSVSVPSASRRERTSKNPEPLIESNDTGKPASPARQDAGGPL
jgi:signal transduction histidine kinase